MSVKERVKRLAIVALGLLAIYLMVRFPILLGIFLVIVFIALAAFTIYVLVFNDKSDERGLF